MKDLERLWNYYLAGRPRLPRPRYLCYNSTMRCDGRCGHCGIWRRRTETAELGAAELGAVLARPLFGRVETAWITGGEPTLREDVGELARAMTGSLPSLLTLGLTTNGFDPARVTDRVEAMRAALRSDRQGLFIQVSVDGVGEVHDRARGRAGLFDAVVQTLDRLEQLRNDHPTARLDIGLNCVIQPANVAGLDDLRDFARRRGLPITYNVAVVTDQIYHNLDRADSLRLTPEQAGQAAAFLGRAMDGGPAVRYQHRTMREVLAGRRRPRRCLALYTTININADGTLIPCPASSEWFPRNVAREDPAEVWYGREARAMRKRVERELCPGCMLSCSLGDSMPLAEWWRGGWER